jgi:nucleotide-binding universal stress UspA family protein
MPSSTGSHFARALCGIDFSENSRTALQYATSIARRANGKVSAIFVNDPLLAQAAAAAFDEQSMADTTAREFQKFITAAVGEDAAPIVEQVVVVGDPAEEITKAAKTLQTDLIVLGTRGLGGAGKMFFGSTTSRVLRTTGCPILAVPGAEKDGGGVPEGWPRRIVAAIKPGDDMAADARAAAEIAKWFGASLTLASILRPVQSPIWLLSREYGKSAQVRLGEMRSRLASIAPTLDMPDVGVHVADGDVASGITAAAREHRADLIVLRLMTDEGLLGDRQGSVTYRVLSSSHLPVVALSGTRTP